MEMRDRDMDKRDEAIAQLKEKLMVAEAQRLNGEKTISREEMIKKFEMKNARHKEAGS